MPKEYTQEELLKILEKLPEEVKEVLFSEKTADHIDSICKKYGVPAEKISEVAKFVGQALLRILSLEELPEILEKEIGLKKTVAKNVSQEIELAILNQIKGSLKTGGITPTAKEESVKEEPLKPRSKDIYHEPIV